MSFSCILSQTAPRKPMAKPPKNPKRLIENPNTAYLPINAVLFPWIGLICPRFRMTPESDPKGSHGSVEKDPSQGIDGQGNRAGRQSRFLHIRFFYPACPVP